jgi:hypothetical protein
MGHGQLLAVAGEAANYLLITLHGPTVDWTARDINTAWYAIRDRAKRLIEGQL